LIRGRRSDCGHVAAGLRPCWRGRRCSRHAEVLEFSQAEREFLFTAPVSRRQLLLHRIVRSQVASIIASLFVGLFAAPIAGVGRLRLALGFWVLAVTINV
jgi:ABC-type multidrug transport system permease subunit